MQTELPKSSDTDFSQPEEEKFNWLKNYSFSSPLSVPHSHMCKGKRILNGQVGLKLCYLKIKIGKGKNCTLGWNILIFWEDSLEGLSGVFLSFCHHSLFCRDWSTVVVNFAFELCNKMVYRVIKWIIRQQVTCFSTWGKKIYLRNLLCLWLPIKQCYSWWALTHSPYLVNVKRD